MNRQERRRQRAMLRRLAEREINRLVEGLEDYEETGAPRKKVDDERAKKLLKKCLRSMVAMVEPEIVIRISDADAAAFPAYDQKAKKTPGAKWFLAVGFDAGTRATYAVRWIDTARLAAEAPALTPQDVMLEFLRNHTGYAGFPT